MTFYVWTVRPFYCKQLVYIRAVRLKDFHYDCLPPDLTTLWKVERVRTQGEAIACVIEKGAGKKRRVSRIIPRKGE